MLMKIEVAIDDIKYGEKTTWHSCAVAIAVQRATNLHILVTSRDLVYSLHGKHEFVRLPRLVRLFIAQLDGHAYVEPFSFQIAIPDRWFKRLSSSKRHHESAC
jgi:hypothetical protein